MTIQHELNRGYFIAQKLASGAPGRPVGSSTDDGAISLFEELTVARRVRDELVPEHGPLSIFQINLVVVGEVIA